jgi:hypothetical protein
MAHLGIYLLFFFLIFNSVYLIGHIVFCTTINQEFEIDKSNYLISFLKLSLGLLSISFITANYCTGFKTINIILIMPFLFLTKTIQFNKLKKIILTDLFRLNLIALPVLLLQFIFFSDYGKLVLLPDDIRFYSAISFYLPQGYENGYECLNLLNVNSIPKCTPYHYFDLWLTVFFKSLLPFFKNGYLLLYVTYPILITTYLTGILALFNVKEKISLWKYMITYLLLFVGPLIFTFYQNLNEHGGILYTKTIVFENTGFFENTLSFSYYGQKHLVFYLLILVFIHLIILKKEKQAFIILSIAPIINIGLLPNILLGTAIYTMFLFYKQRTIKEAFNTIFPLLTTTIAIIIFYSFFGSNEKESFIYHFSSNLNYKGELMRIILRIFIALFYIVIMYLPFIFLIFNNTFKNFVLSNKKLFLLFACFLLAGLFTRPFFQSFNSAQFLTYLMPAVNVLIVYSFIHLLNNSKNLKNTITLILLMAAPLINTFIVYHSIKSREIKLLKEYDQNYVTQVLNRLAECPNSSVNMGYLLDSDYVKSNPPILWYSKMPNKFILDNNYFNCFNLDYPYYKYPQNSLSNEPSTRGHMRYLMNDSIKYGDEYIHQLQSVINRYKIKFICANKNAPIPLFIKNKSKKIIIDQVSQERFIELY